MRIHFLGTSHGFPEPNRQCSCTMLEVSGQIYFIDMGRIVTNELVNRGIPVDTVKSVFITHMHGDHTNGLPDFVDLLTWYYKSANPSFYMPTQEGVDALQNWVAVNVSALRDFNYVLIQPGVIYEDGLVRVTAIATKHCNNSFAYLVEAEGKQILFTGDLKLPSEDFPEIAKQIPLDLVVCEAAHFTPARYLPVFQECRIKTVCFNHYPPRHIGAILQLNADLTDTDVRMAHDGMELTL